jgi:hypothetical protein
LAAHAVTDPRCDYDLHRPVLTRLQVPAAAGPSSPAALALLVSLDAPPRDVLAASPRPQRPPQRNVPVRRGAAIAGVVSSQDEPAPKSAGKVPTAEDAVDPVIEAEAQDQDPDPEKSSGEDSSESDEDQPSDEDSGAEEGDEVEDEDEDPINQQGRSVPDPFKSGTASVRQSTPKKSSTSLPRILTSILALSLLGMPTSTGLWPLALPAQNKKPKVYIPLPRLAHSASTRLTISWKHTQNYKAQSGVISKKTGCISWDFTNTPWSGSISSKDYKATLKPKH